MVGNQYNIALVSDQMIDFVHMRKKHANNKFTYFLDHVFHCKHVIVSKKVLGVLKFHHCDIFSLTVLPNVLRSEYLMNFIRSVVLNALDSLVLKKFRPSR